MNKIQLFSEKATYASPSSKLIILQGRQSLMQDSGFGDPSRAGDYGYYDDSEEDDRM